MPYQCEVVVAYNPVYDALTAEMWSDNELLGEIIPLEGVLYILIGKRHNGKQFKMSLREFDALIKKAKEEAQLNLSASETATSEPPSS